MFKKLALLASIIAVSACSSDVQVVKANLSKDADMFQINRRIVFYNSITNDYMLEIEGLCSVDIEDRRLTVICKTGKDSYKKHVLGRSDNVTFFVQQIDGAQVDRFNYKVIFKPASIIPDIQMETK